MYCRVRTFLNPNKVITLELYHISTGKIMKFPKMLKKLGNLIDYLKVPSLFFSFHRYISNNFHKLSPNSMKN